MQMKVCIAIQGTKKEWQKGSIEVPEGWTVEEVLKHYFADREIPLNVNLMPGLILVVNAQPGQRLNRIVKDGDVIQLFRQGEIWKW